MVEEKETEGTRYLVYAIFFYSHYVKQDSCCMVLLAQIKSFKKPADLDPVVEKAPKMSIMSIDSMLMV
jgi:hypothetical protein